MSTTKPQGPPQAVQPIVSNWATTLDLSYPTTPLFMEEKDTSLSSSPPLAAQLPPSADDDIGSSNNYDYVCYRCSKPDPTLACAACKVARYCSKECQKR